jgi:hypothetical protein
MTDHELSPTPDDEPVPMTDADPPQPFDYASVGVRCAECHVAFAETLWRNQLLCRRCCSDDIDRRAALLDAVAARLHKQIAAKAEGTDV